ncbi:MAG: hypothetical protein DWH91_09995 [Planctomycetota bacterium]|nr:MAG: hypothetical protein DWH91_09995 [Planctomycetota bacterium]
MTITKGLGTVMGTGFGFGAMGAFVGFLIGKYAPDFYRVAFSGVNPPPFDPPVLGLALGLVQGLMVGIGVGLIVVLAVTWSEKRLPVPERST